MKNYKYVKMIALLMTFVLTATVFASCGAKETGEASEPSAGTEESSVTDNSEPAKSEPTSEDGKNGGDFDVSTPKWVWVEWDGDKDGKDELISFEYIDNGDEAESFILVTLEQDDKSEAFLDRSRKIVRIFSKEDADGPYLEVECAYKDVPTTVADFVYKVRIKDGAIVAE